MRGRTSTRLAAVAVTLAVCLTGALTVDTAAAAPAKQHRKQTTARWSGALDTADRAAVDAAYGSEYAAGLSLATGWTGSTRDCRPGTVSSQSRSATLRAINFVRSLGGLAPVSFSEDLNERAQATALIMSANRQLSHSPGRSWRCYTSVGAANAGKSNLALAWPSLTSSGLVSIYMTDDGASNTAVGHRRWLLNPFSTTMGSGATDDANALTVIGPTSANRPNPSYVGWPSAGWFPSTLEPDGRWSLSAGNRATNFTRASVRVYRNGSPVPITKRPVRNGYAQPTLVWEMPDSVARSGTFEVVVNGIRLGKKKKRYRHSYSVTMFNPTG